MRTVVLISFSLLTLFSIEPIKAQDADSILTETEYLKQILQLHPLAQQAENLREMGQYSVMNAKGGFDPYLSANVKQKYFDNKNYYLYRQSELLMPTRLGGLKVRAGFDWNEGEFLSNESTVPPQGLWFAGVELPLLNGLIIDERRAALQRAFIENENFNNEARLLLNDLLLQGSNYYWKWVQFQKQLVVINNAIELTEKNLDNFVKSFQQGDKPAIDTLEASIQLQNFRIQQQQVENDLEAARLQLFTFLWQNELQPEEEKGYSAGEMKYLQAYQVDSLSNNLSQFIQEHPKLKKYELKLQDLRVDNRLKREKLKPKLDLQYNLLQDAANNISEIQGLDNYQWGVKFSFPIFLRAERGALRMNELKVENTNYEYQLKKLEIQNKARQYETTFKTISQQLSTYREVVQQYERLLKAEIRKFNMGESSIFLINYRQISLVNANMKYIELQSKYRFYYRQWLYALGADTSVWLN